MQIVNIKSYSLWYNNLSFHTVKLDPMARLAAAPAVIKNRNK